MNSQKGPSRESRPWPACNAEIARNREGLDSTLLRKNAPERVLDALMTADRERRYNQPEEFLRPAWDAACSSGHTDSGNRYLRLLLAEALARLPEQSGLRCMPSGVHRLLRREATRILEDLRSEPVDFYHPDNDLYLKDLAICRLKLLPCGAELVERHAGVPRSLLWRGGARQLLCATWFFTAVTRGFRSFYALHMDPRRLEEFSPEGWERSYHRIAALLEREPQVKGVFGTAWFYDPAVARISPHLAYLREFRERHGAMTFRYGPTESARHNAAATSRTRRRLMEEEGRYEPASYYVVWPRQALLTWARRHPEGSEGAE